MTRPWRLALAVAVLVGGCAKPEPVVPTVHHMGWGDSAVLFKMDTLRFARMIASHKDTLFYETIDGRRDTIFYRIKGEPDTIGYAPSIYDPNARPIVLPRFVRHADGRVTVMVEREVPDVVVSSRSVRRPVDRVRAAGQVGEHMEGNLGLAATSVTLRFHYPDHQTDGSCGDGATLAWLDSVRVLGRKRGPHPWNAAAWLAYQKSPDTLIAQKAVAWTRMGQLDSFVVAALDTGATAWLQVHGTRGWSPVCRWVSVGAR